MSTTLAETREKGAKTFGLQKLDTLGHRLAKYQKKEKCSGAVPALQTAVHVVTIRIGGRLPSLPSVIMHDNVNTVQAEKGIFKGFLRAANSEPIWEADSERGRERE